MIGYLRNSCILIPQRLQSKVIKLVDVSYGGENGFNQAIELAAESLANVKFIQEKKLIGEFLHFHLTSKSNDLITRYHEHALLTLTGKICSFNLQL